MTIYSQAIKPCADYSIPTNSFQENVSEIAKLLDKEKQGIAAEAFQTLEAAFEKLSVVKPVTELEEATCVHLRASILVRYGVALYPSFEKALPYLLASLHLRLQSIGFLSEALDCFSSLKAFIEVKRDFPALIEFFKTTDAQAYPQLLTKLTDTEKLSFAEALLYVCHCYGNMSEACLNMEKEDFVKLVSNLAVACENIALSCEATQERNEFVGEIYYHVYPNKFLDACELKGEAIDHEKLKEHAKLLERALQFNPEAAMKARIANLKGCILYSYIPSAIFEIKGLIEQSLTLWKEAQENIHQQTPRKQEQWNKLFQNVNATYGAVLRKLGEASVEEIEKHASFSLEFYKKYPCTNEFNCDPYTMIHLLNLARFELKKGQACQDMQAKKNILEAATFYAQEVDRVSEKFIMSWPPTENYVKDAQKLKEEIVKAQSLQ